jgi:hypothetical protein
VHARRAGDAHYTYSNAPSFAGHGPLSCHNRRELLAWLDGVCAATQAAHDFHLVVSDDEEVLSASLAAPGSPITLPTFIAFKRAPSLASHFSCARLLHACCLGPFIKLLLDLLVLPGVEFSRLLHYYYFLRACALAVGVHQTGQEACMHAMRKCAGCAGYLQGLRGVHFCGRGMWRSDSDVH